MLARSDSGSSADARSISAAVTSKPPAGPSRRVRPNSAAPRRSRGGRSRRGSPRREPRPPGPGRSGPRPWTAGRLRNLCGHLLGEPPYSAGRRSANTSARSVYRLSSASSRSMSAITGPSVQRVGAGLLGRHPSVGADDRAAAGPRLAAFNPGPVRARDRHPVAARGAHRDHDLPRPLPVRAVHQRPVGRHQQQLRPGQRDDPRQLRELDVVADDHRRAGRRSCPAPAVARRPARTTASRDPTGAACGRRRAVRSGRTPPRCCTCGRRRRARRSRRR